MAKTKILFNSDSIEPMPLSRSKIDLFLKCPRCFYLDRKLGISQPSGAPFTLNIAVDSLLKKEFDIHRKNKTIHPLLIKNGIDAIPFDHSDIEKWRNNRKGIRYYHEPTNFEIYGAIDDVWITPDDELIIVDYKAKASSDDPSTFLEPKTKRTGEIKKTERYKISYKKQLEIYQWLFRKNGFKVIDTAYFIFANAQKDKDIFNDRLDFEKHLIAYEGNNDWVESTLIAIHKCLSKESLPEGDVECDYCNYRKKSYQMEGK
jgi:CRISPR/Cas system-associated exonuclease Cas4 (RecB family)